MGNAVPLGQITRVRLGGCRQLGIDFERLEALVAAILIDDVARLVRVQRGRGVISI